MGHARGNAEKLRGLLQDGMLPCLIKQLEYV